MKGGRPIAQRFGSRKWQITINNPVENECAHEDIKNILFATKYLYFCMCDEIGDQGTPHTHVYVVYANAVLFDTMKKRFPTAHLEKAHGTSQENRDYIRKEGKWQDDAKKETNLPDTFEEYGDMPLDSVKQNETVSAAVLEMIKSGIGNREIIETYPSYFTRIDKIEKARQLLREDENKDNWRNVEVIYIFGETGTGKTRSIMEKYGYSNVHRVTNYEHPFDNYQGQDVLLFDEFRSGLPVGDMLNYTDGYPCNLPCRYADKVACFTRVYIVSNISLSEQYRNIQYEQPKTWLAFLRRFKHVYEYRHGHEVPFCEEETAITELDINDFRERKHNV